MKLYLILCTFLFSFNILSNVTAKKEKLTIYFMTGGPENGSFAKTLHKGALQAAKDLDLNVVYLWSKWKTDLMVLHLKNAIDAKPDGIAIMGHPGDNAYKTLIQEAISKGIIVTSQNVPLEIAEQKYMPQGFGYVGANQNEAGKALAQAAVKKAHLKANDIVGVWGIQKDPIRGKRSSAILAELRKEKVVPVFFEFTDEEQNNPIKIVEGVKRLIKKHPKTKLIIFDHGGVTSQTSKIMKQAGLKPGKIKVAGFDISAGAAAAIKENYLTLTIDQQPFLQGYLPILQIYLTKKYKFSGLHINTAAAIIDKSNIDTISQLAKKGIR